MKKSISKIYAVLCVPILALALICVCMFAACTDAEGGEKYTYSDVTVDLGSYGYGADDTIKNMYNNLYQDSYILVSDSKIEWVMEDTTGVMSVTKDGDKYILGGDYVDKLSESMGSLGTGVTYEMYGVKSGSGFNIVMTINLTAESITETITFKFVK